MYLIHMVEEKIRDFQNISGGMEILLVLHRDGESIPTKLLEKVSISQDTFYKPKGTKDKLLNLGLIEKYYNKEKDKTVWALTKKGKQLAMHLGKISQSLCVIK